MKPMNLFLKIALLYSYMYFVGPCIWGIWMVYKLDIITLQEFAHSMLSPVALIMFASYLLFNLLHMRNALNKLCAASAPHPENPIKSYYFDALKAHCISLVSFGTIGTAILMLLIVTDDFTSMQLLQSDGAVIALIGSLSGASLIFLFYPAFSMIIFTTIADRIKTIPLARVNKTLIGLMGYNRITYVIGLLLLIGTGVVSIILQLEEVSEVTNFGQVAIYGVSMALPIFMSALLYRKSIKKTKPFLQVEGFAATLISGARKEGKLVEN